MAIEKLPIRGYEPYGIPIVDKINEIIDYATRMDEDIKNNISEKVEQEPNKVELVPLDISTLVERIAIQAVDYKHTPSYDVAMFKKNIIPEISKYGVPTQKKFGGEVIAERAEKKYGTQSHFMKATSDLAWKAIVAFLRDNNLLEE